MDLMDSVRRPVVHNVKLQAVGGKESMVGSLCVSAYYLLFSTRRHEGEDEITMLNTAIESVEHRPGSLSVLLVLKDFRQVQLEFSTAEEAVDLADALRSLSRPSKLTQLYAFAYLSQHPLPPPPPHPSPTQLLQHWRCDNNRWRISHVNKDFKVCPSYPEEVIVPNVISDDNLIKIARFRQSSRFPVLSYHHQKTQAVIVRCGQPHVGPGQRNRCKEDEKLLNLCLPSLSKGKILDTRTQDIVTAHTTKGGGVELPAHYPQWKLEYGKMETRTGLATSLSRLREACVDATSSSWWSRIDSSGWISHVAKLLSCAKFVALSVHRDGASVVVHGTTGVDSTLQICSLAQILLDPNTRTITGFIDLIQREWLDGGHPFSLRHGHTSLVPEKDKSPSFLLFIDAVWQVTQQFPLSFEFTEQFLHQILVHSYSSEYGTFLYDTPQERYKHKHKTQSLWSYLAQPEITTSFTNPLYDRNSSFLTLSISHLSLTLWSGLYVRGGIQSYITIPALESKMSLRERNNQLHQTLNETRKQLVALQSTVRSLLETTTN